MNSNAGPEIPSFSSSLVVNRLRKPSSFLLRGIAIVTAAIVLLPILTVIVISLSGTGADWPHLAKYVLPQATKNTLLLLFLVALGTAIAGVGTAWLVVALPV